MTKANVFHGRIETHGEGEGLPTRDTVLDRAREIAITNGRLPEQVTAGDIADARQEILGAQNGPTDDGELDANETTPLNDAAVGESWGHKALTKLPADEQTSPADLVREGVEEAAHEQLLEGNKQSRKRDEAFEDQLPSTEP